MPASTRTPKPAKPSSSSYTRLSGDDCRRQPPACCPLLPLLASSAACFERLETEARVQQQKISQIEVSAHRSHIFSALRSDELWSEAELDISAEHREELLRLLSQRVSEVASPQVEHDNLFLHASEHDRAAITGQFREALGPVSAALQQAASELQGTKAQIAEAQRIIDLAPSDLILQPIAETLQSLTEEQQQRRTRDTQLAIELATAEHHLARAESQVEKVRESLAQHESTKGQMALALRAQRAIRHYADLLRHRKIQALERVLVQRFNQLCRKSSDSRGFLESVRIDPSSFAVSLVKGGGAFERTQLSAGEKQLFAVATLWALREVADLPMPVIVDTPFGRLDSDHRSAMVQTFLPQVAHQVILLATDTEVDEAIERELAPAVSHGYRMTFDADSGATRLESFDQQELLLSEEHVDLEPA